MKSDFLPMDCSAWHLKNPIITSVLYTRALALMLTRQLGVTVVSIVQIIKVRIKVLNVT